MPDYTVSGDVDSMLRSANDAAIRSALDLKRATPSPLMSMVIVGDSISNEFLTGQDGKYGSCSWPNVMAVMSGGAIHVTDNAGVPGQVSTTLAANIASYVSTRYPTHVVIYIGVNDVSSGSVATATISANILTVVDWCIGMRIVPILSTVCPRYTVTTADIPKITALNDEIRNIAQARGVSLLDLFDRAVDLTTGLWKDGYTRDGLHPNSIGAKYLAEYAIEEMGLGGKFYHSPNFAQTTYDGRNLIANGLFQGSPPTNWTLTGGGSLSLVAGDSDIIGNWGVITAVSEAETSTLTNSASIAVTAGDRMCFAGRIWTDVTSRVDLTGGVTIKVTFAGATAGLDVFSPVYLAAESYPRTSGFSFESVVPAGATSATVSVVVSAMVGVVRIAQLKLQNLTANNAAIPEPGYVAGTRGDPDFFNIHYLHPNAGMGTAASTLSTGPGLKTAKHIQAGNVYVGGTLLSYATTHGNSGTAITDLRTHNIQASQLAVNGDYLRYSSGGSFAANANIKQIWAYFGTQLLFNSGALAFNAGDWSLEIIFMRAGATTQSCKAVWTSTNSLLPVSVQFTAPTATLTSSALIKLSAQGGATDDVVQKIHAGEFFKGWG